MITQFAQKDTFFAGKAIGENANLGYDIDMSDIPFPVVRDLKLTVTLSLVIALLSACVSLAGLFFQDSFYLTDALRQSFVSNDAINLFLGLPILLGSLALARRSRLIGLLFWPGALFYVLYNYMAYAVAMPFTMQFVFYLTLAILSIYTIFRLLSSIDAAAVQQRLVGVVPERLAAGVLVGLGTLFFLRGVGQVLGVLSGQVSLPGPELAVTVADLLTTPAWVVGGIPLWRRRALGYVTGAGLLFQASMLLIGLLIFFILQPFLAGVPFPVDDFVVIFITGLVCFIPFGLFTFGVIKKS